nr:general transcription factor 3C polypeptide 6 isoform X1 [Ipomoea batatas]
MEQNFQRHDDELKEEEYVLMDLDSVSDQISIPPNAPYVLSGLDTLNPILTIDGKIKLIGEYVETIGTCLVFGESDAPPVVHEETGPSDANLFSGKCIADPKQASAKRVNPITQLQKIIKFKLLREGENDDENVKANDDENVKDDDNVKATGT